MKQSSRHELVEALELRRLMSVAPAMTAPMAEPARSVPLVRVALSIENQNDGGTIAMLDYDLEPLVSWEFQEAWPEKQSLDDDPARR